MGWWTHGWLRPFHGQLHGLTPWLKSTSCGGSMARLLSMSSVADGQIHSSHWELRLKSIGASFSMLLWSMLLLAVIQCTAGRSHEPEDPCNVGVFRQQGQQHQQQELEQHNIPLVCFTTSVGFCFRICLSFEETGVDHLNCSRYFNCSTV